MQQLIQPNLNTADFDGWCLRFVENVFNISKVQRHYNFAIDAWNGATFKHADALPDVVVPVWFNWTGTVQGKKANYGDVALWVPGKGVFGTPLGNVHTASNRWDSSVEARAKAIGGNASYLGWTEDLTGVRLVQPSPVAPPAPTKQKVFLPASAGAWRLYDVGAAPVKANAKALLRPDHFPPGLTYDVLAYNDNGNTVEIQTQMFGRGKIWIKDTPAQVR